MAVDRQELVRALVPEEPDYAAIARVWGHEATPVLVDLAGGADVELAAKAASVAGLLAPASARGVLERALAHPHPIPRVAAASALERQPELAADLADPLFGDPDVGVRKWMLRALGRARPAGVRGRVEAMASTEEVPALAQLARQVASQLPP